LGKASKVVKKELGLTQHGMNFPQVKKSITPETITDTVDEMYDASHNFTGMTQSNTVNPQSIKTETASQFVPYKSPFADVAPTLISKGVTSLAERVAKTMDNKPLMDSLKKNPAFAKEYMKLISDDIKSDAFNEAMKNPYLIRQLSENLTKKGPLDMIEKGIKNWWALPAAVGATVVGKESIVDPIVQSVKSEQSYKDMATHTPQLMEADQEKLRHYFDVIKTYSPHAAANPLVAGALVNKMMEFGGVDHKLVQDMINIQAGRPTNEALKTMVGGGLKTFSSPVD
jgi:hypothetical protein